MMVRTRVHLQPPTRIKMTLLVCNTVLATLFIYEWSIMQTNLTLRSIEDTYEGAGLMLSLGKLHVSRHVSTCQNSFQRWHH